MPGFNRDKKFGKGKNFKPYDSRGGESDSRTYGKRRFDRPSSGGSDRTFPGRGESYDVICAKCGIKTDVPFRPTNNKPVFCRDCFRKSDGDSSFSEPRSSGFNNSSSSNGISSAEIAAIHKKLDKILEIMESLELDADQDEDEEDK